jgi:hypothetical protein
MITNYYNTFDCNATREVCLKAAKGVYQRNLLHGVESWSGSTLRGAAKAWSSKYCASRKALLQRIAANGVVVRMVKANKGRHRYEFCSNLG